MTDRADPCAAADLRRSGCPDRPSRPSALLPYLVLLPMGFTEPGRSPGLLVSSYLAVSPLPRSRRGEAARPRRFIFCGTVPIRAARADPDGGRYPPSRPEES